MTKQNDSNPDLEKTVEPENDLKNWLVEYVGAKSENDSPEVTVAMIVDVLAEEFPEFLMAVAEENWIRGYHQGLSDVEMGEKLLREHTPDDSEEQDEQAAT